MMESNLLNNLFQFIESKPIKTEEKAQTYQITHEEKDVYDSKDADEFTCTEQLCSFSSNLSGLRRHIESVHKGVKRKKCGICDFKSYYIKTMKAHHRSKHSNQPFVFTKIGRNKKKKVLKAEYFEPEDPNGRNVKKESEALTCTQGQIDRIDCEMSKKEENNKEHVYNKILKGKRYSCKKCDEVFGNYGLFLHHRKSVHGTEIKREGIQGKYKCSECPYTFDVSSKLSHHISIIHKKLSNFKCNLCDYKAYSKQPVRIHQQSKLHGGQNVEVLKINK